MGRVRSRESATARAAHNGDHLHELLGAIRRQYRLSWLGIHGVGHWARVLDNGLRLAPVTGADPEVVCLFALFHDACRANGWANGPALCSRMPGFARDGSMHPTIRR